MMIGSAGGALGTATGIITLDVSGVNTGVDQAMSGFQRLDSMGSSGLSGLEQSIESVGLSTKQVGLGFTALGAAMLAPIAVGVKGAMSLEQAFTDVKASMDPKDYGMLGEIEDMIIDIGASGQYSALEIAAVTEELVKGGFAINDILSGDPADGFGNMAQAVSDLSSATGSGLGPAVQGISAAMNIWNPRVVDSSIALTDAAKAADIFTVAANASAADTTDIIAGMRNFGPVAAGMGIGFEDAAAAIAMFTNYGLKATVAGTALSTGMQRLAAPTGKAAELMDELGISAWDSQGSFIGMPELFDQLRTKMGGMSDEAKMAALTTIFGAEAMDVMGLAVLDGADSLNEIIGQMEDYGIAGRQAAMRTQTLQGALERLSEGFFTMLAVMAGGLIKPLTWLANTFDLVTAAIMKLPEPMLHAIGIFTTFVGLAASGIGAFLLFAPKVREFTTAVRALSLMGGPIGTIARVFLSLTGLAGPFGRLAASILRVVAASRMLSLAFGGVIGLGILAYQSNLLGFGDWVDSQVSKALSAWKEFKSIFGMGENDIFDQKNLMSGGLDGSIISEAGTGADGKDWFVLGPDGEKVGQILESYKDTDGTIRMKVQTDDGSQQWLEQGPDGLISWAEGADEVSESTENASSKLERFNKGIDTIQSKLGTKGFGFLNPVIDGFQATVNGIAGFTSGLKRNIGLIGRFNDSFMDARRRGMASFGDAMRSGWNSIKNDIGEEGTFLRDIGDILFPPRAMGEVREKVSKRIGDALGYALNAVGLGRFSDFAGRASEAIGSGFGKAKRAVGDALSFIGDLADSTFDRVADGTSAFADGVGTFIDAFRAYRDLAGMTAGPGAENASGWDKTFGAIAAGFRAVGWDGMADAVEDFGNRFSPTYDKIAAFSRDAISKLRDFKDAFTEEWDELKEDLTLDRLQWEMERLGNFGISAFGKIATGASNAWDSIRAFDIGEWFQNASKGKGLDGLLENFFGSIADFAINVSLDLIIKFLEDPGENAKKLALAAIGASLAILVVSGGIVPALILLGIVGLAALAAGVVKQVVDYFRDDPAAVAKIQMKISTIWSSLEQIPILGLLFKAGRFMYDYFWSPLWNLGVNVRQWMKDQGGIFEAFVDKLERTWMGLVAFDLLEKFGKSAVLGKYTKTVTEEGKQIQRAVQGIEAAFYGLLKLAKLPFKFTFQPLDLLKQISGGTDARRATEVLQGSLDALNHMSLDELSRVVKHLPRDVRVLAGLAGNTTAEFRALNVLGSLFVDSMRLTATLLRSFFSPIKHIQTSVQNATKAWQGLAKQYENIMKFSRASDALTLRGLSVSTKEMESYAEAYRKFAATGKKYNIELMWSYMDDIGKSIDNTGAWKYIDKAVQEDYRKIFATIDKAGGEAVRMGFGKRFMAGLTAVERTISNSLLRRGGIANSLRIYFLRPFELAATAFSKIFRLDNWIETGMTGSRFTRVFRNIGDWINDIDMIGEIDEAKLATSVDSRIKTVRGLFRSKLTSLIDNADIRRAFRDIATGDMLDDYLRAAIGDPSQMTKISAEFMNDLQHRIGQLKPIKSGGKMIDVAIPDKAYDELRNLLRANFDNIDAEIFRIEGSLGQRFVRFSRNISRSIASAFGRIGYSLTSAAGMPLSGSWWTDIFRIGQIDEAFRAAKMTDELAKAFTGVLNEVPSAIGKAGINRMFSNIDLSAPASQIMDDLMKNIGNMRGISNEARGNITRVLQETIGSIDEGALVVRGSFMQRLLNKILAPGLAAGDNPISRVLGGLFDTKTFFVDPKAMAVGDVFTSMFTGMLRPLTILPDVAGKALAPLRFLGTQIGNIGRNFNTTADIFSRVFPMFGRATDVLDDAGNVIRRAVPLGPKLALGFLAASAASAIWSWNLFGMKDAFGGVVSAIGGGIGALVDAFQDKGLAGVIDTIEGGIIGVLNDIPGTIANVANSPAWDKLFSILGIVGGMFIGGPIGLAIGLFAPFLADAAKSIVGSVGRIASAWDTGGWEAASKVLGREMATSLKDTGKWFERTGRSLKDIGEAVESIPMVGKPLSRFFNSAGRGMMDFGRKLKSASLNMHTLMADGMSPMQAFITSLSNQFPMLGLAIDGVQKFFGKFGGALGGVGIAVLGLLSPFGKLKDAFSSLLEGDVRGFFTGLWDTFTTGLTSVANLASAIANLGGELIEGLMGSLAEAFPQFGEMFTKLGEGLGNIFDGISDIFTGIGQLFSGDFAEGIASIGTGLQGIFSGLWDVIQGLWAGIMAIDWGAVWQTIQNAFANIDWSGIGNGILNAFSNIDWGAILAGIGRGIRLVLAGVGVLITGVLPWILDGIGSIVSIVFDGISDGFDAMAEKFPAFSGTLETIGNNVQVFGDVVEDILGTIAALLRGDWGDAWNHFKEAVTGVADLTFAPIETLISLITTTDWDTVTASLDDWAEALRGMGPAGTVASLPLTLISLTIQAIQGFASGAAEKVGEFKTALGDLLNGDWEALDWDALLLNSPLLIEVKDAIVDMYDILTGDWDSVDWNSFFGIDKLQAEWEELKKVYEALKAAWNWVNENIFGNKPKTQGRSESKRGEDPRNSPEAREERLRLRWLENMTDEEKALLDDRESVLIDHMDKQRRLEGKLFVGDKVYGTAAIGSNYSDPYRPNEGGSTELTSREPIGGILDMIRSGAFSKGEAVLEAFRGAMGLTSDESIHTRLSVGSNFEMMATATTGSVGSIGQVVPSTFSAMAANAGLTVGGMVPAVTSKFMAMATDSLGHTTGMQTGVNGALGSMVASAPGQAQAMTNPFITNTQRMSAESIANSHLMNTGVSSQFSSLSGTTGKLSAEMASRGIAESSRMSSQMTAQFGDMSTAASAKSLGASVAVATNAAMMANRGISSATEMNTGMTTSISTIAGMISGQAARWVAIAIGLGGTMYGAGTSVGAQLGNGIAAGLDAAHGRVAAAAARLVATAAAAAAVAGAIHSPSRLFRDEIGYQLGAGTAVGIIQSIPEVERAVGKMIDFAHNRGERQMGASYNSANPSSRGSVVNNYFTYDNSDNSVKTTASAKELSEIARKAESAARTERHMRDPRGYKQYGGRRR